VISSPLSSEPATLCVVPLSFGLLPKYAVELALVPLNVLSLAVSTGSKGTRCSPRVEGTANTFIRIEIQPTTMTGIVYECIECSHRVRDDEDEKPASFACPECRGVMKRVYL
jgi:DNA-directed RNA polymerase subunit RPC12/RpoP